VSVTGGPIDFNCLMIAFITCNSNLGSLLEGLCQNSNRFEFSVFGVFAGIEPTTSGLTAVGKTNVL